MSSNGDKSFQVSYLTATSPPHSPARTGEADLGVGVGGAQSQRSSYVNQWRHLGRQFWHIGVNLAYHREDALAGCRGERGKRVVWHEVC